MKNKYSDDLTIEIHDGGTVYIQDNLDVAQDLTVGGDIVVTGTIGTESGDFTVPGDLDVAGNTTTNAIETDNYNLASTLYMMKWLPVDVWINAVATTSYSGINVGETAIAGGLDSGISNYVTYNIGHSTNPGWHVYLNIDPYIPDGCTVEQVILISENYSSSGVGTIAYQVDIEQFTAFGVSTTITTIGSDTATQSSATGIRTVTTFTVNSDPIDNSPGVGGQCVRLKFIQDDSTIANVLTVAKLGLKLGVSSINQALHLVTA